ncbi:MAG TPA: hypothetical protein VKU19_39570 [Bryobacteraceae bacterium]|nr:hypothetical protein [Bryobacteraceae bacterium]
MSKLRLFGWLLFAAGTLFLAGDCVRISASEYFAAQGTDESLSRAVEIWPHRADYYRHLAVLQPDQAAEWLAKAGELNPWDAHTLMRAGLQAETDGDYGNAERLLLHAAEIDRTYEPRWTLCNYYFRRNDQDKFWHWARAAAANSPEDLTSLFDLCWRLRPEAKALVAEVVPPSCGPRRQFFEYLAGAELQKDTLPLADQLLTCPDSRTRADLSRYTEWLFFHGMAGDAWNIWKRLELANQLPFPASSPGTEQLIANSDFQASPSREGFDWHADQLQGVLLSTTPGVKALRLSFDGTEPEAATVLYHPLLLHTGVTYELSYDAAAPGREELAPGFQWRLVDISDVTKRLPGNAPLAGPAGNRKWRFSGTAASSLVLALEYERPEGLPRFRGTLELRHVSVSPMSPQ